VKAIWEIKNHWSVRPLEHRSADGTSDVRLQSPEFHSFCGNFQPMPSKRTATKPSYSPGQRTKQINTRLPKRAKPPPESRNGSAYRVRIPASTEVRGVSGKSQTWASNDCTTTLHTQ